jgi:hypothetical protein
MGLRKRRRNRSHPRIRDLRRFARPRGWQPQRADLLPRDRPPRTRFGSHLLPDRQFGDAEKLCWAALRRRGCIIEPIRNFCLPRKAECRQQRFVERTRFREIADAKIDVIVEEHQGIPNTICGRWIYALSDSCLFHRAGEHKSLNDLEPSAAYPLAAEQRMVPCVPSSQPAASLSPIPSPQPFASPVLPWL